MQHAIHIDDFSTAEELTKHGGFSDKQAKSLVRAIHLSSTENLATKTDIANIKADITTVREDMLKLENRLTNRILSIAGLQTAFITLILALLKFWH